MRGDTAEGRTEAKAYSRPAPMVHPFTAPHPRPRSALPSALVPSALVLVTTASGDADLAIARLRSLAALGYAAHCIALDQLPRHPQDGPAIPRPIDPIEATLARIAGRYDVVYLQHTAIAARCLPALRRHHPAATILLEGEALCRTQRIRQAALQVRPDLLPHSRALAQEEAALARAAHAILAASPQAADQLRRTLPGTRVHAIPPAIAIPAPPPSRHRRSFARRRGLACIARFDDPAELAAARWLVHAVMPLVWQQDPSIECLLVGPAPDALHALAGPGVTILGRGPALAHVFGRVRLSVGPMRQGGPARNALASIAARTPCVLTPAAAAGLGLPPPLRAFVASDPATFATHILALHTDPILNRATARAGATWLHQAQAPTVIADALRAAIGNPPGASPDRVEST